MMINTLKMTATLLRNFVEAGKILILVDSTTDGVELPEHILGFIRVKLNLSKSFKGPLEIGERETRVTLSFGGKPYKCVLPHHAIYYVAMADDPLSGVEIPQHTPIQIKDLNDAIESAFEYELANSEEAEEYLAGEVQPSEKIANAMLDAVIALKKDPDLIAMLKDVGNMCSDPHDLELFMYSGMGVLAELREMSKDSKDDDELDQSGNEIDFEEAKKNLDSKKD
jgi:stringent starvation protein B